MKLAHKLQSLMDGRGLSIRDVAAQVGTSPTTVARWLDDADLKAEPRLSQAWALARLFGVPLEFLADDAADQPAPGPTPDDLAILRVIHALIEEHGPDEPFRRLMRGPRAMPTHLGHPIVPAVVQTIAPPGAANGTSPAIRRGNGGAR